jgi:predicted ATPase
LVEREQELATFERTLALAKDGAGATIIVEAPAGNGKSRLLTIAGDMARAEGMQVLGASASELEQDFPFGIAIQLFAPRWTSTAVGDRVVLLDDSARAAGELLDGDLSELQPPRDHEYRLIVSLYSLTRNLASGGPLVMVVDDVHWSDRSSLRFLVYLAYRLADRPIVLVVAVREE